MPPSFNPTDTAQIDEKRTHPLRMGALFLSADTERRCRFLCRAGSSYCCKRSATSALRGSRNEIKTYPKKKKGIMS